MSPHGPGPLVLQLRSHQIQSSPVEARSVQEQKEEKESERSNQSSSCFISGSCDRKCKVFTGDLSERWIAAGAGNAG